MGIFHRRLGQIRKSDNVLYAFGHSVRIYAWPIVAITLAASCWLILPSSPKSSRTDPLRQAIINQMWQSVDYFKLRGSFDANAKNYANELERQTLKSTGPRPGSEPRKSPDRSTGDLQRRILIAANLAVIGIILGWICFLDRRYRVTITPSDVRIAIPGVAVEKTFVRSNVELSILRPHWLLRALGLGVGALLIRTKTGEKFIIPRVFRASTFLQAANKLPIAS